MKKLLFIKLFFLISNITYSDEKADEKHLFSLKCNVPEINIFGRLDQKFVVLDAYIYDDLDPFVDLGTGFHRDTQARFRIYYHDKRIYWAQFNRLRYSMENYEIKSKEEQYNYDVLTKKNNYSRSISPFQISSIKINRTNLNVQWTFYESYWPKPQDTPFEKFSLDSKCEIVDRDYSQRWESSINNPIDKKIQEKLIKIINDRKI